MKKVLTLLITLMLSVLLIVFLVQGTHTTSGVVTGKDIYGSSHKVYFETTVDEKNIDAPFGMSVLARNYHKYNVGNRVEMRYLFGNYWTTDISGVAP